MLNWDDPIAQFKPTGQPNPADTIVDEKVLNIDQEPENSPAISEDKVIYEHAATEDKATIKPENIQEQGVTGLEEVEFGAGRLAVDDKAMINCRSDVNQLVPFKYKWAWQKYLDGCANHWMPQDTHRKMRQFQKEKLSLNDLQLLKSLDLN